MEFANTIDILVLLFGNGLVVALIGFVFQRYQRKSDKDFEARRDAKDYYMTLYAHIGILDELTKRYVVSLQDGKAEVFEYAKLSAETKTSDQIIAEYKLRYQNFLSFYVQGIVKGSEIYVSKKLKDLLIQFWNYAKLFNDDPLKMKQTAEVDKFNRISEKTTDYMEKLFGLK